MTQKELDIVFNITILIYEHSWFKEKKRTRDEVQAWVAEKLRNTLDIYSYPCGISWGVLCTKEEYEEYKTPSKNE